MFGVNFTYSIQTAASDVDMENARHGTESDSDDGCPAESPEMVFLRKRCSMKLMGIIHLGTKIFTKSFPNVLKMQRSFKVDVLLKS